MLFVLFRVRVELACWLYGMIHGGNYSNNSEPVQCFQECNWGVVCLECVLVLFCVLCVVCCVVFVGGCEARFSFDRRSARAVCGYHKSRNKGLISVDRRTSLLSHVQYPVPSESSTKDLSLSVPERRLNVVLGRSLSLRVNTESGYIVAFQHRFWLRGVQSLSCRW